ncbi:MAG: formamidopyrimidine-DNA glycosylase [Acidimicrobiales bacterium]|nr:formamidopyrimidine-DNA glycosylase [Acidimicrobiales bacterium]
MPELPDVVVYLESLERLVLDRPLRKVDVRGISLLRSYDPPLSAVEDQPVIGLRRLGKRLVFAFPEELYLVLHLMVAGRLQWKKVGAPVPGKVGLAAFRFDHGTLTLTEAGTKKRASLWVVRGEEAMLAEHDRGGIEPLTMTLAQFTAQLTATNRTLKRALTDPTAFSGIGNAYSDEILWSAGLAPTQRTGQLDEAALARLYESVQATLVLWTERLRGEAAKAKDGFPEKVTAFRDDMAVHGRFGKPCPRCGDPVQRISYAENEVNYCATCQHGGKLLADRSLSRLLTDDWPKTIEEWEGLRRS